MVLYIGLFSKSYSDFFTVFTGLITVLTDLVDRRLSRMGGLLCL
jgi:hypothetical protein